MINELEGLSRDKTFSPGIRPRLEDSATNWCDIAIWDIWTIRTSFDSTSVFVINKWPKLICVNVGESIFSGNRQFRGIDIFVESMFSVNRYFSENRYFKLRLKITLINSAWFPSPFLRRYWFWWFDDFNPSPPWPLFFFVFLCRWFYYTCRGENIFHI